MLDRSHTLEPTNPKRRLLSAPDMTTTPRNSLYRRTHSLTTELLSAGIACHHIHGLLLSGCDTDALGQMTKLIQHMQNAMQDRREITRLIKKGVLSTPSTKQRS